MPKRLIDANALKAYWADEIDGEIIKIEHVHHSIDDSPTVDAVSVVRCDECIEKDYCSRKMRVLRGYDWTNKHLYRTVKVEYCSYGKRKDDVNDA